MTPAPHPLKYRCDSLNKLYEYATHTNDDLSLNKTGFLAQLAYLFYEVDEDLKRVSCTSTTSAELVLDKLRDWMLEMEYTENHPIQQKILRMKKELRRSGK